ncbi:hypothetical protein [Blastococcus sp. SYSU D00695]
MSTESELQERLRRLAERAAPAEDPHLDTRVVARARAQRRQRAGLAALTAAVAAVVVAVPAVLAGPSDAPSPAVGDPAPASTPAAVDVLAGPPRGPLAGDAAFLEGVRQLPWTQARWPVAGDDPSFPGLPDPPVQSRRVVWAGDVAGARWALVTGPNTAAPEPPYDDPARQTDLGALSDVAVAWFVGPPGAAPAQMVVQDVPHGVDPTRPLGYSDADTGAVVLVTAPGDAVAVSRRPEVAADARVTRTYDPVPAPDGVAVLALTPSGGGHGLAVRFRVTRDGAEVATTSPDGRADPDDVAPDLAVSWRRERPTPSPADGITDSVMRTLLATTGLGPADVPFSVLWSGDVPAPAPRPARVAVVTGTLPSGAVWVGTSLGLAADDGSAGGTTCGSALRPASDAAKAVAAVCHVSDMTAAESPVLVQLVVVGPPGAGTARLLDDDGAGIGELPLTDGVGVGPAPRGLATVELLDGQGRVLDRTSPLDDVGIDW